MPAVPHTSCLIIYKAPQHGEVTTRAQVTARVILLLFH